MRTVSLAESMVALALSITVATAEVRTREDAKGRTVEIIGLADPTDCHPLDFGGTIVKREFAPDALTLTGIVIEVSDGTREFINVEIPKELNMALRGNVYRGLQQLTRIGRKANGRAFACGVAGRVQTLDAIR